MSDGTNQPVSWAFTIDHYNQLPVINYEIIRSGSSSDDMMLISFLGTEDPEGDGLYFSIYSNIQGMIWTGDAENGRFGWEGRFADHSNEAPEKSTSRRRPSIDCSEIPGAV